MDQERVVTIERTVLDDASALFMCWAHAAGQTYRLNYNPEQDKWSGISRDALEQCLRNLADYINKSAHMTDEEVRQAEKQLREQKDARVNPFLKDNWRERASFLELQVKKEQERAEEAEKELKLKKSQLLHAMNDIGRLEYQTEADYDYERRIRGLVERAETAEKELRGSEDTREERDRLKTRVREAEEQLTQCRDTFKAILEHGQEYLEQAITRLNLK